MTRGLSGRHLVSENDTEVDFYERRVFSRVLVKLMRMGRADREIEPAWRALVAMLIAEAKDKTQLRMLMQLEGR